MSTTSKTKLTITVVPILLLMAILLLISLGDKNTSGLLPNHNLVVAQTETLKKETLPQPSVKSAVTNKVSANIDMDMTGLEQLLVKEMGDEVRTKLGRHAFEKEIMEMTDHPESVFIKFKPEIGSTKI